MARFFNSKNQKPCSRMSKSANLKLKNISYVTFLSVNINYVCYSNKRKFKAINKWEMCHHQCDVHQIEYWLLFFLNVCRETTSLKNLYGNQSNSGKMERYNTFLYGACGSTLYHLVEYSYELFVLLYHRIGKWGISAAVSYMVSSYQWIFLL